MQTCKCGYGAVKNFMFNSHNLSFNKPTKLLSKRGRCEGVLSEGEGSDQFPWGWERKLSKDTEKEG